VQELWTNVEAYLRGLYIEEDDALQFVLAEQIARGIPEIQVSPFEGRLLQMLVKSVNARKVLEIGTLGGYSAIQMARMLPDDGKVITLEVDAKHAELAQAAFVKAGVAHKVELRLGAALETLGRMKTEAHVFDFVFIDADKENNVHYVQAALAMSRPGTLIVVDNVIRDGDVINSDSTSPMTQGVRRMNEYLRTETRLFTTTLQTVGSKGYDGMLLAQVQ